MLYEINVFRECLNGKRLKYWGMEVMAPDLIQAIEKSGLKIFKDRIVEIRLKGIPKLPKVIKPQRDGVV